MSWVFNAIVPYYDRIANIVSCVTRFRSIFHDASSILVKIGKVGLQLDRRRGYLDLRFYRIRRSSMSLRLLMAGSHGVLQFRFQLGGLRHQRLEFLMHAIIIIYIVQDLKIYSQKYYSEISCLRIFRPDLVEPLKALLMKARLIFSSALKLVFFQQVVDQDRHEESQHLDA